MIDIYKDNPAYAGFDKSISANFNYRTQWTGVLEHPTQINANVHLPIYLLKGGAGLKLNNETSGAFRSTSVKVSFNRVESFANGILSIGLAIGMKQIALDGSKIRTPNGIYDGSIQHLDPILPNGNISGIMPDWTLGFFGRNDFFDVGLTIENLFFQAGNLDQINFQNTKKISFYGAMPLLVNGLEIQPSLYIKSNTLQIQSDISVLVKSGNIFGGLGLRGFNKNSFDALSFIGGIRLNEHYTLSYGYDYILNELSNFSEGTHEININYNFNKLIGIGLPPEIIYNPRHF